MPRLTVNLDIKATAAEGRGASHHINKAAGACVVSVAGMWGGKVKIEYAYDKRNAGGWTTTSGGEITGPGVGVWADQVETVPAHALWVSVLTTGDITDGVTPLVCKLIYDAGAPS